MDNTIRELNELFALPPVDELPPDILGELQSILRLHSISPTELSYKWESYTMKMGTEQTSMDLDTARAFKKDLQEMLERDSRGKTHQRSADKRTSHATPRSATKSDDVFGMYVGKWDASGERLIRLQARRRRAEYTTSAPFHRWICQAQVGIRNTCSAKIQ